MLVRIAPDLSMETLVHKHNDSPLCKLQLHQVLNETTWSKTSARTHMVNTTMQGLRTVITNMNNGPNLSRQWTDVIWLSDWKTTETLPVCDWIVIIPFDDQRTQIKPTNSVYWKTHFPSKNPQAPILERLQASTHSDWSSVFGTQQVEPTKTTFLAPLAHFEQRLGSDNPPSTHE